MQTCLGIVLFMRFYMLQDQLITTTSDGMEHLWIANIHGHLPSLTESSVSVILSRIYFPIYDEINYFDC